MKIIYLAVPYSDPDPAVREYRFNCVNEVALELIKQGHLVFSPISQTHPMEVTTGIRRRFDFWWPYNTAWIDWCEELYVLQLKGWNKSEGVSAEIEYYIWSKGQQLKPIVWLAWKGG